MELFVKIVYFALFKHLKHLQKYWYPVDTIVYQQHNVWAIITTFISVYE